MFSFAEVFHPHCQTHRFLPLLLAQRTILLVRSGELPIRFTSRQLYLWLPGFLLSATRSLKVREQGRPDYNTPLPFGNFGETIVYLPALRCVEVNGNMQKAKVRHVPGSLLPQTGKSQWRSPSEGSDGT